LEKKILMKRIVLTFCAMVFLVPVTFAGLQQAPPTDTVKKLKPLDLSTVDLKDDPFVARLDSMLHRSFFVEDSALLSTRQFMLSKEDTLTGLSNRTADSVFEAHLQVLNDNSPIELVYNDAVQRYINVYIYKRREQVSRMLGLAEYYFPMFEEALDQYNMPLELKYLAVVESALNPSARSRVGAQGLWQFMYATGKMNGLSVSSYVDERNDPIKATHAACKYLSTLYGIFGDWSLALAAYNSGPGNVNKAIRRSGGQTNYWAIRPYLPRETQGYVPAFIAVNYVMQHASSHYIFPLDVKRSYFACDTVSIKEKISFGQIAKLIDIEEEELSFLNPAYRYKIVPKTKNYHRLILPSDKAGLFAANEDSIYALAAADFKVNEVKTPAYVEQSDRVRHKVRRGEVLGTIAERYGVSVRSIKRWNNMRGTNIRVGQRLTIYPRKFAAAPKRKPAPAKTVKSPNGDYEIYTVRNGDNLYAIAKRYPGISADNIKSWNNISNVKSLKPGMTLKIYTSKS
jgi:membrane-bound lytic murein transglycosylase D